MVTEFVIFAVISVGLLDCRPLRSQMIFVVIHIGHLT